MPACGSYIRIHKQRSGICRLTTTLRMKSKNSTPSIEPSTTRTAMCPSIVNAGTTVSNIPIQADDLDGRLSSDCLAIPAKDNAVDLTRLVQEVDQPCSLRSCCEANRRNIHCLTQQQFS